MFIGHCDRSAPNPACISAARLRATARALGSAGQCPASGWREASSSAMARLSITTVPSGSRSAGAVRAGG